ncbi:hypothetical protein [Flagellimonas marinaquae]
MRTQQYVGSWADNNQAFQAFQGSYFASSAIMGSERERKKKQEQPTIPSKDMPPPWPDLSHCSNNSILAAKKPILLFR